MDNVNHLEKFKLQIELGDNNKKLEGTKNLEHVAQEFESLFVHQMLKSARWDGANSKSFVFLNFLN